MVFNINPNASSAVTHQPQGTAKPDVLAKPSGNFSITPGSVNASNQTSVEIAGAKKCDCTEKRTTSLGGNQNTIPDAAKQKVIAEKQTLPPSAKENIASDIATAKKCDCTEKRTTNLGGTQNTIPDSAKQKVNAEKQSLPPAALDDMASEIANAKKCDCTAKRTTSLGGNQNTIPSESKQKVISEQLASRFGYESKVSNKSSGDVSLVKNFSNGITISNQPNPTVIATQTKNQNTQSPAQNNVNANANVQVVSQRAVTVQVPLATVSNANNSILTNNRHSPVQMLNTSVTAQNQTVQFGRQNVLNKTVVTPLVFNFGEAAGSKTAVKFSIQVPVQVQANQVTQNNQQTLAKVADKLTQQVIAKFGEMATKDGVKLTALQKALTINDSKLIKEMLNVKANSYGYINLATLRQGIEANFLKHNDLDKMLKAVFGQNFNPEAIEENLSDPLQLFADYLKEQRRLKILKEHQDERRQRNKNNQNEEQDSEEEEKATESAPEPVLAI